MKKTVAIVGSHPRSEQTFNFSRTDCDIWAFNEALNKPWFQRANVIFQLHVETIWRNPKNRNDPNHINWLMNKTAPCNRCDGTGTALNKPCDACDNGTYTPKRRDGVTVYLQKASDDIPNSETYPYTDLQEILMPYCWDWNGQAGSLDMMTSSIPFALALAVLKGYERIELHGIEMETNTEYMYQRDGMTFWKGFCIGRGIQLIHYTPQYAGKKVYGYEGEGKLDLATFTERIQELEKEQEKRKQFYEQCVKEAEAAFVHFRETGQDAEKVVETLRSQVKTAHELHIVAGALQENQKYEAKARAMMGATNDFQISRQEFEAALQGSTQQENKANIAATSAAGAADAYFREASKHKNYQRRKNALKLFANVAREYLKQGMLVGLYQGAAGENRRLMIAMDDLVKAAGGEKSEQVFMETRTNVEV